MGHPTRIQYYCTGLSRNRLDIGKSHLFTGSNSPTLILSCFLRISVLKNYALLENRF